MRTTTTSLYLSTFTLITGLAITGCGSKPISTAPTISDRSGEIGRSGQDTKPGPETVRVQNNGSGFGEGNQIKSTDWTSKDKGGPQDTLVIDDIHFAFDDAHVEEAQIPILEGIAKKLRAHPEVKVVVLEGHADERGTDSYNMALGSARANAVMSYLASLGIEKTRLSAESYGKTTPVDPRSTEEAWAKNRRVHFAPH